MHVEATAIPVSGVETPIAVIGPVPGMVPSAVAVIIRGIAQWTLIATTTAITIRIRQGTGPVLSALPALGPPGGFVSTVASAGSKQGSTEFRTQDQTGSATGYTITAQTTGSTGTVDFCAVDM